MKNYVKSIKREIESFQAPGNIIMNYGGVYFPLLKLKRYETECVPSKRGGAGWGNHWIRHEFRTPGWEELAYV